jgi:DNA-binding SARP family transcriptional activator
MPVSVVRRIGALGVLGTLLLGLPALLVAVGSRPWLVIGRIAHPERVLRDAAQALGPGAIEAVAASCLWLVWAWLVCCVVVEVVSLARGVHAPRLPGARSLQVLVASLLCTGLALAPTSSARTLQTLFRPSPHAAQATGRGVVNHTARRAVDTNEPRKPSAAMGAGYQAMANALLSAGMSSVGEGSGANWAIIDGRRHSSDQRLAMLATQDRTVLGYGIAAVALAACIVGTLDCLRRVRTRRRAVGERVSAVPERLQHAELRLRRLADRSALDWALLALRAYAATSEHRSPIDSEPADGVFPWAVECAASLSGMPQGGRVSDAPARVAGVRVCADHVELLRMPGAPDVDPPAPFRRGAHRGVWCVPREERTAAWLGLRAATGGDEVLPTAFVVLGVHAGALLMVDLEALGALEIVGPGADAVLRAVALGLATSPWSCEVEVIAVGVPGLEEGCSRLEAVASLEGVDLGCGPGFMLGGELGRLTTHERAPSTGAGGATWAPRWDSPEPSALAAEDPAAPGSDLAPAFDCALASDYAASSDPRPASDYAPASGPASASVYVPASHLCPPADPCLASHLGPASDPRPASNPDATSEPGLRRHTVVVCVGKDVSASDRDSLARLIERGPSAGVVVVAASDVPLGLPWQVRTGLGPVAQSDPETQSTVGDLGQIAIASKEARNEAALFDVQLVCLEAPEVREITTLMRLVEGSSLESNDHEATPETIDGTASQLLGLYNTDETAPGRSKEPHAQRRLAKSSCTSAPRRASDVPPVLDGAPGDKIGCEYSASEVEVCVLGPVEIRGAARQFRRAWSLELVVYLAMHRRGVRMEQWATAFWPDRLMAPASLHSIVSAARRALGSSPEGSDHLPRAHGVLRLSSSVRTDWERFQALASLGRPEDDRAALELVRGRPFQDLRAADWTVVEGFVATIEAAVVDVACRYAEHALASGDPRSAEFAARKGLAACPYDERLYRLLMRAADLAGSPARVEAVMQELVKVVADDLEPYDSVHPETYELYCQLSRRVARKPSGLALDRQRGSAATTNGRAEQGGEQSGEQGRSSMIGSSRWVATNERSTR